MTGLPGTNRYAILIDGYVFKIAMDKDGVRDNWSEFSLSQELQPFVIKVYECNGLIIVTEYVTVISKEEFVNSKDEIRQTLSYLAQGYLLGDVGSVTKNFMNWGYRDDKSLVILDFAYIYRVLGEEMICGGLNSDGSLCQDILEYDQDFNNLICPKCRKKYTFHDIRRKINREYEIKEISTIKKVAYKVTEPNQIIGSNSNETKVKGEEIKTTEDNNMGKHNYSENNVDIDELYLEAISFLKNGDAKPTQEEIDSVDSEPVDENEESIGLDSYEDDDEESVGLDSYEDEDLENLDSDDACTIVQMDDETPIVDILSNESEVPQVDDTSITITTENTTKVTITADGKDIDELRKLISSEDEIDDDDDDDIDDDDFMYDEYEDMYDEIDNENLSRKLSMKQKKILE